MTAQTRPASPARGAPAALGRERLEARLAARLDAASAYFGTSAAAIAACAAAMADRFFAGGTLLVLGAGAQATDAQHNSVEYVHPVLPGCRALAALALSNDIAGVTGALEGGATADVFASQLRVLGREGDIALAFTGLPPAPAVVGGLEAARQRGMLTVALVSGTGDPAAVAAQHRLHVAIDDPMVAQEVHLATYHMLWELVHIVLNHRGIALETRA